MTEEQFLEAKRLRTAARQVFDTQKAMIKSDLSSAGVGKRITSKLVADGKIIAEEAADVANNNRQAVALGGLALTALLLRKPIMAFAERIMGRGADDEYEDEYRDDRDYDDDRDDYEDDYRDKPRTAERY